ncbi:hypothetical protein [Thiobaca trueperi]|uniref:Uncharacterized protein n=1 Tax=Thiobaca trueperi TaxID=127458 RepID=A0A4R3N9P6_9GAMM|nr:hypothetical protein [Thiobaca trueperi]TCT23853.1 hypothetical protein EDC35_101167 [Thiobaca trueperi]
MAVEPAALDKLSSADDWADADLLSAGFAAHPLTLRKLQRACGFTDQQAADACLVSLRTYRRWCATGKPDPTAVRLLAILAGFVPWSGWHGWEVHRGYLFPPGYTRGGILPSEFFALVFYRQQVSEYQRLHAQLKARVQLLEAQLAGHQPLAREVALQARVQALGVQVQALGAELAGLVTTPESAVHG